MKTMIVPLCALAGCVWLGVGGVAYMNVKLDERQAGPEMDWCRSTVNSLRETMEVRSDKRKIQYGNAVAATNTNKRARYVSNMQEASH